MTPPLLLPVVLRKNVFSRERVKTWCLATFNISLSHIFPENFIKIPQVVQTVWRFTLSSNNYFNRFFDFLTFPCSKETKDVTYNRWCRHFFYFQTTINRLFNNCLKLCWHCVSSPWNMKVCVCVWEGGVDKLTSPEKNYLEKAQLYWS